MIQVSTLQYNAFLLQSLARYIREKPHIYRTKNGSWAVEGQSCREFGATIKEAWAKWDLWRPERFK